MSSIFSHNVVEVVSINLKIPVIILVGDPLCVSDVSEILTKSEFNLFAALELDSIRLCLPDSISNTEHPRVKVYKEVVNVGFSLMFYISDVLHPERELR